MQEIQKSSMNKSAALNRMSTFVEDRRAEAMEQGGALEEVVPKAFGGDDTDAGGLEQIDNLKDGS